MIRYRYRTFYVYLIFIVSCFILYLITTLENLHSNENLIKMVRHRSRRIKGNSWVDNSATIRRTYSSNSFTARTKRQVRSSSKMFAFPDADLSRSTTQMKYVQIIGCSHGYPDSTNFYSMTGQQTFPSPIHNAKSQQQLLASPNCRVYLVPAFFKFQPPLNGQAAKAATCGSENLPFYCAYIPLPVLQAAADIFSKQPWIAGFNGAHLQRTYADRVDLKDTSYSESTSDCPINWNRCDDGKKCVPKVNWCDNVVHCPDASDETNCSCRDRIAKTRICDNYYDCPKGEDELGCFGCPENSFSCNNVGKANGDLNGCVAPEQRCDGSQDCANGKDEEGCSILLPDRNNEMMFPVGYSDGFLYKNARGKWYLVCGYAYTWARAACELELGFMSEDLQFTLLPNPSPNASFIYLTESGTFISGCPEGIAYVRCSQVATGTRVSARIYPQGDSDNETNPDGNVSRPKQEDPWLSIVGGRASAPRAWPSVVALTKNGKFHCGGTILNERWVLSAAHCFHQYPRHYYEVEAGQLRRSSYSSALQVRRVNRILVHPLYKPKILRNDIALLWLTEPLRFNSWVRPALLPRAELLNLPSPGTVCVALGWGAVRENGPDPDILQEVKIPIINCVHPEDNNIAEICAGYMQGGRDACQGDSGGPLMCRVSESSSKWYIGGIVSHGIGCGRQNEPGAYTKVSHFINWIDTIMYGNWSPEGLPLPLATCPGFSCSRSHPRCLSMRRRCDLVADCWDAEDEVGCSLMLG